VVAEGAEGAEAAEVEGGAEKSVRRWVHYYFPHRHTLIRVQSLQPNIVKGVQTDPYFPADYFWLMTAIAERRERQTHKRLHFTQRVKSIKNNYEIYRIHIFYLR
jgi:hypothetical protein